MAFSVYHAILITTFIVCGSINTLTTKWADETKACGLNVHCDKSNPDRKFDHPFIQTIAMFLGESLCFFSYWLLRFFRPEGREVLHVPPAKWFMFLPPALLDMLGTTVMYIGLNLTYASSFQMLRGAVIVFTGLLSVAFLGRTIRVYMWVGITVLTLGLIVIGIADVIFASDTGTDANGIVSGDLLIIMAQIIAAIQFVYEEKYLKKYNVPALLAVGLEGVFGATALLILIGPMYYIPASKPFTSTPGHLENGLDALAQMKENWIIILATVGCILSIPIFNFCGISITKELSATTRQVMDSGRTLFVWAFSLIIGWQPFEYRSFLLQLLGFAFLLVGMMIYSNIVFRPFLINHNCLKVTPPSINDPDYEPPRNEANNRDDDDEPLIS